MPTPPSRPIPPLYTVYILRSSIRHTSLYIGSTPNPPRRLKQHNGVSKGGAARTSRATLRPWEMVGLVSGFPGQVAALKFEWALTNPHLSLHIPSSSRITISSQKKRSGQPKRPRATLSSIVSNLHLLLRVPSFSRLPLALHFFAPEVHDAWSRWCATANEPLRATIPVLTDFKPVAPEDSTCAEWDTHEVLTPADDQAEDSEAAAGEQKPWGIHALPLDYAPMRDYVTKTESIFAFERQGRCLLCRENMPPGEGLYVVCPNSGCEGVGHATCWSQHLLRADATLNTAITATSQTPSETLGASNGDPIIPISGHCPSCRGPVAWGDMIRELSLRSRGPKEVQKLLKKPRKRRVATTAAAEGGESAVTTISTAVATAATGASPRKSTTAARAKASPKRKTRPQVIPLSSGSEAEAASGGGGRKRVRRRRGYIEHDVEGQEAAEPPARQAFV